MPRGRSAVPMNLRRRPGATGLLPVAAAALFASAVARFPIVTPDVWWHLATGRAVADSGIPRTDLFSWTLGDRPWLAHEWLADLVLHAASGAGGLLGVVALRAALLLAAACLAYRAARLHASLLVALPLAAAAGFVSQRNWLDRPQLWSYALAALLLLVLERDRLRPTRFVYALPLLFALWVNLHGGFMLGLVLLVLWTAAARLEARQVPGPARPLPWWIAPLCLASTLLNPHGLEGVVYPWRYVGSGLAETIQEEQAGLLAGPQAWMHLALALALVVLLVAPLVRGRRVPLPHVVVAATLVWLSMPRLASFSLPLAAERHVPLFLFAAVPILAWRLESALGGWPGRALERAAPTLAGGPAWLAGVTLAGFALWSAAATFPRDGSPRARLLPGRFPEAGAAWLASRELPPRLVNPYRWGGFLAYRLGPRYRVSIDSRGDLYGPELLREDELLYRMPPGSQAAVESLLARWDADVIVWYFLTIDFGPLQVHPFTRWLLSRSDWRLVFYDRADPDRPRSPWATTAIFLRVHERNAAELGRLPAIAPPAGLPR